MEKRFFGLHHCYHKLASEMGEPWYGEQHIFRFPNGLGASVIRRSASFGGKSGMWEIAVIRFTGRMNDQWDFANHQAEIHGWLSESKVTEILHNIRKR